MPSASRATRRPANRSSRSSSKGGRKILPWIKEYSPYELVTADDPPIFLAYGAPPALGQEQKDPTHTANFGVKLQEKCRSVGVECYLAYPGATDLKYRSIGEFLIAKLAKLKRATKLAGLLPALDGRADGARTSSPWITPTVT